MAYFSIGTTAPEFSRYDAYRRILSKQVVAGILLTGQYANGLGLPEKRMLLWEGGATDDKTKSYFEKM